MNFIKKNYLLIIILILAFAVRLYGIYFDFPATRYIYDETYEISYIVKALAQGTIYPDVTLQYSFFLAILYLPFVVLKLLFIMLREGIYNLPELKEYMILYGMGELMIITRWFSVLFGTASVYLSYLLGKLIWNKKSALLIALGFAFSFVSVFLSHWGRRHIIMAFFILLTLYFVLRFQKNKNKKWFYYSNLSASLAIASHYLGINALIFPLAGYLMNRKEVKLKDLMNNIFIYIISFVLFYVANWNGFVWMIKANLGGHYAEGSLASLSSIGTFERFYFLFRDLFFISPLIVILGALALFSVKKIWQNKLSRYIIFAFLFNYLIMIFLVASPHNTRWLIVFSVYLTILAFGCFGDYIFRRIKSLILVYILVAIILLPGVFISLKYGYLLNQNTRVEAQAWIQNNIKRENKIYSFDYIVDLPLSVAAAKWQTEENKVNSTKNKYILDNQDKLDSHGYNLFYDFGKKRYETLGGEDTAYVLLSYNNANNKKNIIDGLNKYYQLEPVKTFFPGSDIDTGDSVNNPNNIFKLFKLNKSGPYIEIYKIK
ncbi:MAG: glycosyltransferase family 39 protein [Patescibacteria group bacterium]|nr:glycosyltransferase family 39 protein [Patescibacteria group bacterium]